MKRLKLVILLFVLLIPFICILQRPVFGTATPEDAIKKLVPDGKNIVLKMFRPKTWSVESMFLAQQLMDSMYGDNIDGCVYHCYLDEDDVNKMRIDIFSVDYEEENEVVTSGYKKTYDVHVIYDEPDRKYEKTIKNYSNKLKKFDVSENDVDINKYLLLDDLSLINYYVANKEIKMPLAAKYTKEVNTITEGSNISFHMQDRLGSGGELYRYGAGTVAIAYNEYFYDLIDAIVGVYISNVIYIPQNTPNNKEAYITAAQERIDSYLGKTSKVKISYGGTLDSIGEGANFGEDITYKTRSDNNYYNVTINNKTYKFYIKKANKNKLTEPVYSGKNLATNIKVSTNNASVPLDTNVEAKQVTNSKLKNIIGTSNYESYDIKLKSESNVSKIEKLGNGSFKVSIPIDQKLNGKNLVVYYVDSNNKVTEHAVTINNNYATFETDHFSVYTLAEKPVKTVEKDISPETGTVDLAYLIMALAILSMTGTIILNKKENKK